MLIREGCQTSFSHRGKKDAISLQRRKIDQEAIKGRQSLENKGTI